MAETPRSQTPFGNAVRETPFRASPTQARRPPRNRVSRSVFPNRVWEPEEGEEPGYRRPPLAALRGLSCSASCSTRGRYSLRQVWPRLSFPRWLADRPGRIDGQESHRGSILQQRTLDAVSALGT